MTSASVSDFNFDFIMTTILCQGTDSPLRKALLRDGFTDLEGIMCLGGRYIHQLKFPDDSSGIIILKKLADEDQRLIHCFVAFVRKKIADGNWILHDWQNLTEITEFQEFKIIGYASYYNDWYYWRNVSCNEEAYNARYNALDNELGSCVSTSVDNGDDGIAVISLVDDDSPGLSTRLSTSMVIDLDLDLDLDDDDDEDDDGGIEFLVADHSIRPFTLDPLDGKKNASGQVKPSEPSRLDCRVSSSADDIFEDDPIPSKPPGGLGSRLSSLAVDLSKNASGQVKPSEPSRLDYRVSSSADDIFEDDPIPSEPPDGGLGSRLSSLAVDLFEQSIPSEPPKLHSRLSSAVCKNAWGAVQEDQKPSRLGSRLSRSADEHDNGIDGTSSDDGIAESISSKPVGLGTRQSRSTDNVFECDDGITSERAC
jgi:hypothetical protein